MRPRLIETDRFIAILAEKEEERVDSEQDSERDKDGWPRRWSDPTYLGDGPWGA